MEDIERGVARIERADDDPDGFREFVETERLWD